MLATRYSLLATQPISDNDFAGEDVRYSSEFEAIEASLEKASSLYSDEPPDWQHIVTLAEKLLENLSKDLRVACWLTWALYRSENIAGLQAGVAMLNTLFEHWDSLHPRRPRTRIAAFLWLTNRLEAASPELLAADSSAAAFNQLYDDLNQLDHRLQSLLGDQSPLLRPLCRQLRDHLNQQKVVPLATTPEKPEPVASPAANETTLAAPVGSSINSPRDAHKALRTLQEQARTLCQWWQTQAPTDCRPIHLSRTLLWLPIEAMPEHDDLGKTDLRGLPADRINSFQERVNQNEPAPLLREIEHSLTRAPFWLDGQYLAWRCLDELKGDSAKQAIEQHLANFLHRLPGIENLLFFDNTPFASAQTLSWLNSRILTNNAASEIANPLPNLITSEPWDTALTQACELLRTDGLKAALAPIHAGLQVAQGGRARLHWQLASAQLLLQAGKYELAINILEGLQQLLGEAAMTRWEPQLRARVMRLLLKSHELHGGGKASRQRRNEVYQQLCQLDFEMVLEQALGP